MRKTLARRGRPWVIAVALLGALAANPVRSDSISDAHITLDLTDSSRIGWTAQVDWVVDLGPVTFLEVYLIRDVTVTSVHSGGSPLPFRLLEGPEEWLKLCAIELADSVASGASCTFTMEGSVNPAGSRGIHRDERGGFLLPGAGWFPQTSPEMEEVATHRTVLVLPPGARGIAAGVQTRDGAWEATIPARPYAVWGEYEVSEEIAEGTSFLRFRRPGAAAAAPRLDTVAQLLGVIGGKVGEAGGAGPWKLIDVDGAGLAGGQRTLFWNEPAVAAVEGAREVALLERDLAGALAAGFWTESIRFRAGTALWLARGVPLYLGDVAALEVSGPASLARESLLIGARRAAFLESIDSDRSLGELLGTSPEAERILATRGALVWHLMAELADSRSAWIEMLAEFRAQQDGKIAEGKTFRRKLFEKYEDRHAFLGSYILRTELPDFRISAHGPVQTAQGERYRVEVENRGEVTGLAIATAFTPDGQPLRHHKVVLEAKSKHPIFMETDRLARVVLDVKGVSIQPDLTDESIVVNTQGTGK